MYLDKIGEFLYNEYINRKVDLFVNSRKGQVHLINCSSRVIWKILVHNGLKKDLQLITTSTTRLTQYFTIKYKLDGI